LAELVHILPVPTSRVRSSRASVNDYDQRPSNNVVDNKGGKDLPS